MKKTIFAIVIILILSTGCGEKHFLPLRTEISDLNLIRVIAIDRCKDTDNVIVTVTSKKEGESQGAGGGDGGQGSSEQVLVFSAEAKTVESAIRQFQTYSNKNIFWGHNAFYLIGEGAAKDDIVRCLDFFSRDHPFRLDSTVHITMGKAGEFLEESNLPGFFIADFLKSLLRNVELISFSDSMSVSKLIGELDENETFGIAVPALSLGGEFVRSKGMDNSLKKGIKQEGYAIIKDYKLVGFINPPDSRGYNSITNKLDFSYVNVVDKSGSNIGIDIIVSDTKINPIVEKGQLTGVKIINHVDSNLDEIQSKGDVFNEESIAYLEQKLSEVMRGEMETCIQFAQRTNADFLNIGRAVHLKHPVLWEKIKGQWNEIFPALDIGVEVESHINRTYDIRQPTGREGGE